MSSAGSDRAAGGRPRLRRSIAIGTLALLLAAVSSVIALSAFGGSDPAPPAPTSLAQAIHDALSAPPAPGLTGTATLSGNLLSETGLGSLGASLTSATGQFWATNDGVGKVEVQSAFGSVDVGWTKQTFTLYLPSANAAYQLQLPTAVGNGGSAQPPTVAQINQALSKLSGEITVSGPQPTVVANQPAYSVSLVPKDDSSLIGEVDVAWDATYGIPLQVSITAKGQSTPALEIALSNLNVAAVPAGDATLSVPAATKVEQLSFPTDKATGRPQGDTSPSAELARAESALPFTAVAPSTLDGRALSSAHALGNTALLTYGAGLGTIVVDEAPARAGGGGTMSGVGAILPRIRLGPLSAYELATSLGTIVDFEHDGIAFVVGGSLAKSDVEAAAEPLG